MYEIIATLGPSTDAPSLWTALAQAGATQFRLNSSHMTVDQTVAWVAALNRELPAHRIVVDLQGSKWRIGPIGEVIVADGDEVEFLLAAPGDTLSECDGATSPHRIPVPHEGFFAALSDSTRTVRLNDGKVVAEVGGWDRTRATAVVRRGGPLSAAKGITVADTSYRAEALSEKDRTIIDRVADYPTVSVALSYVKDAFELEKYRAQCPGATRMIAKLERRTAMVDAEAISRIADEVWLCRGDLGAELGYREMAVSVHRFSKDVSASALSCPAILAGQVLEHMTVSATPTRSELCYLHDSLHTGYAGVVLSDETAVGAYPAEACRAAALFRQEPGGQG